MYPEMQLLGVAGGGDSQALRPLLVASWAWSTCNAAPLAKQIA